MVVILYHRDGRTSQQSRRGLFIYTADMVKRRRFPTRLKRSARALTDMRECPLKIRGVPAEASESQPRGFHDSCVADWIGCRLGANDQFGSHIPELVQH